ncbi:DUF4358 domain-containing protein [Clostridia bacterium OttesenSCG-928-F22]|nr:DUF4358 domain-containing protein [Clostridia bacterium OttesenSCG-928-F22]
MKKILAACFALLTALTMLSGCNSSAPSPTPSASVAATPTPAAKTPTVDEILSAIKQACGDGYLPNMPLDDETLVAQFNLDLDWAEDIKGEMPAIGFHPDRVIVVKAKEGQADNVEKALNDAKRFLIDESLQYPANSAKVNATTVVRNGNYIALLLIGAPDDRMDATEEQRQAFAQEETKKAVDAFENCFK